MTPNLLLSINVALGDGVIRDLGAALGELDMNFDKALRASLPAVMAGAIRAATTSRGAAALGRAVAGSSVDAAIGSRVVALSGDREALHRCLKDGDSLLGTVFGSRARDVAAAISMATGATPASARRALAVAVLLVLGALKREMARGGIDQAGLPDLLAKQRDAVLETGFDRRIAQAVGWQRDAARVPGSTSDAASARSAVSSLGGTPAAPHSRWWPWVAAATAIAAAIALLVGA